MTPGEKLDFIKSHLESPAREELRLLPKDDCENPNRLLQILSLWRKKVLRRLLLTSGLTLRDQFANDVRDGML